MTMPKFNASKAEYVLIAKIYLRFASLYEGVDGPERQDFVMDIAATHSNGCPLNLEKLLEFPDYDFLHDIIGIQNHIDRTTGKLLHCFLPRCSRPEFEVANEH